MLSVHRIQQSLFVLLLSAHWHEDQSGMQLPHLSQGIITNQLVIFTLFKFDLSLFQGLRLSQKALCTTDIGQMINLCSNDVNRFDSLLSFLHFLWVGPLVMIITTAVLYIYIGLASIVGMVVLLIIVPIQCKLFFN